MSNADLKTVSLHHRIMALGRNFKKMIMVASDFLVLPFALWSGYALRFSDLWPIEYIAPAWPLFCIAPLIGLVIFTRLGLYRAVVRFMGVQAILSVIKGVTLLSILLWLAGEFFNVQPFPRSVPIIFALVAFIYVGGSRLLVRNYYHWLVKHYVEKEAVLIYGAGGAGVQLASSLSSGREYMPVGFIDDDKSLWGSTVSGMPVYSPSVLGSVIPDLSISHVLLALPKLNQSRRRTILESLSDHSVHILTVPSYTEIVSGESVDALRDIALEDLLGRDPIPPDQSLISQSISNKNVLVSGAGGSIGSEICRQVLMGQPCALILYEINEYALYSINQELLDLKSASELEVEIIPVLGSILDAQRVERVLKQFEVNTIYHAAAYKHVPLVEHNILEGVRNNVLGTKVMAETAGVCNVERFVLISTDKAVRPTNVMGATKRLAEIILQDLADQNLNTVFSMVRFGNVLGSSGSVVPLFREQIKRGGPVTVTHPNITRFFMTIPEAAALVIQAGSIAEGGDVFVLDMGEPVKITYLAERMIQLMGYKVQSELHPEGIRVEFQGLRPGEKLYEELLIGEDVIGTNHPKILRAQEEKLTSSQVQKSLSSLTKAIAAGNVRNGYSVLLEVVSGFTPSSPMVDFLDVRPDDSLSSRVH